VNTVKFLKPIAFLLVIVLLAVGIIPSMAFATEPATLTLKIEEKISGDTPEQAEKFTFELAPIGNAPTPSDLTTTITGEGTATFGRIVYTTPGAYEYTIRQKDEKLLNYDNDASIYHVKVTVTYDNPQQLAMEVSVKKNDNIAKSSAIVFENTYTAPEEATQDASKRKPETTTEEATQDAAKRKPTTTTEDATQDAAKRKPTTTTEDATQDAAKRKPTTTTEDATQDAAKRKIPVQVKIKKVDSSGKLLSGAKLAIEDAKTKETVMEWTTDGKVKTITSQLVAGETYYLVEKEAPKGYLIAADIEFTVPKKKKTLEVKMIDPKEQASSKLGSISVTKEVILRDSVEDVELYTEDETYYVGLFTDAAGNHPYGSDFIKAVHIKKGSHSEPVVYSDLPDDTYYVLETMKDGTPIKLNEETTIDGTSVICEVVQGTSNKVTISKNSDKLEGQVNLVNVYMYLPEEFFYRAEITITVPDKTSIPTDKKVLYIGVFASPNDTTPIDVIAVEDIGTYTVEVPVGDEGGTYYLYETDESGQKIEKSSFEYEVSLDKSKNETKLSLINGILVEGEVSETETSLEDTKNSTTSNKNSTSKTISQIVRAVATGDKTAVLGYLFVMVVAIVGCVEIVRRKKK
jgi:pilin isopeptide linkage protein